MGPKKQHFFAMNNNCLKNYNININNNNIFKVGKNQKTAQLSLIFGDFSQLKGEGLFFENPQNPDNFFLGYLIFGGFAFLGFTCISPKEYGGGQERKKSSRCQMIPK